jgi:hypothetical protein
MGMRRSGDGFDFQGRRTKRAIGDVIRDRVIKQHGLLGHDADLRPQRLEGHLPNVPTVDVNPACAHIEEPRDQIYQGRLPCSAAPDDRHHLPRRHRERQVPENRPRVRIFVRETHVTELNRRRKRRQRIGGDRFRHFGVGVHHLEDAIGRRDRLLQIGIDAAELLGGCVHHQQGGHERRELTGREPPVGDLIAAVPQCQRHTDAAKQFHRRREDRQRAYHPHVCAVEMHQGRPKAAGLALFSAKRLHDSVGREGLRPDMGHDLQGFLASACGAPDALPEADERVHDQRRTRHADDGQSWIDPEHHDGVPHERERLFQQISGRFGHRPLNLPHVIGDAREELTRRMAREETRRLSQDVRIQTVAQIHDHPLPHVLHEVAGKIRAHAFDEVQSHDGSRDLPETLAVGKHVVEDRTDQDDDQRGRDGIDHHRQHRPRQADPVRLCVPEKSEERVHSVKRYFSRTQSATTPSRQVIFLPSSYPRPS